MTTGSRNFVAMLFMSVASRPDHAPIVALAVSLQGPFSPVVPTRSRRAEIVGGLAAVGAARPCLHFVRLYVSPLSASSTLMEAIYVLALARMIRAPNWTVARTTMAFMTATQAAASPYAIRQYA